MQMKEITEYDDARELLDDDVAAFNEMLSEAVHNGEKSERHQAIEVEGTCHFGDVNVVWRASDNNRGAITEGPEVKTTYPALDVNDAAIVDVGDVGFEPSALPDSTREVLKGLASQVEDSVNEERVEYYRSNQPEHDARLN